MLKSREQNDKIKSAIILSIILHCVLIAVLIWNSIHQPQDTSTGCDEALIDAVMVDPGVVVQQYNRQQQQINAPQPQQKAKDLQQKQTVEAGTNKQYNAKTKAKQQVATASKQYREVNDWLRGLADAKNAPKFSGVTTAWTNNSKLSSATESEINSYLAQVRQAISNKFYDASNYNGKTCILHITLAPDGMLISVSSDGGDLVLCQVAVSAAKLAAIPRPPSPKVYAAVKNATLDFKP